MSYPVSDRPQDEFWNLAVAPKVDYPDKLEFQSFFWDADDGEKGPKEYDPDVEEFKIKIFGKSKEGVPICGIVNGFTPWFTLNFDFPITDEDYDAMSLAIRKSLIFYIVEGEKGEKSTNNIMLVDQNKLLNDQKA